MNLKDNPTIDELKAIFKGANDEAGHHSLWVDRDGEVHLSLIPDELSPVGFESATPSMKFRYETFGEGNDYVGENAAADDDLMNKIFRSLKKEWNGTFKENQVKFIDSW